MLTRYDLITFRYQFRYFFILFNGLFVFQLNDMLEKKLADLERSASNLPVYEKELKRLREKTKLLEEDKQVCVRA